MICTDVIARVMLGNGQVADVFHANKEGNHLYLHRGTK